MTRAPRGFRPGETVLVIGVGRSGFATAEVLRARGIAVAAYDDKPYSQLCDERRALSQIGVQLLDKGAFSDALKSAKDAVVSPGVPLTNPAVQQLLAAGVTVSSEIEIAYQLCAAPLIAITGSKGKSTTTALVGHLLRTAGKPVRVGGNIGNPLIRETVAATADEWVVAEVSSFQLEGIHAFSPRIAVLLNISPDHLDRYPSMQAYADAKFRIFKNQQPDDLFVGNLDDPYCAALAGDSGRLRSRALWFGMDPSDPRADATCADGRLLLRINQKLEPLVTVSAMQLRGRHNVQNALAASLAALHAGVGLEALRAGLASFEPLRHRLTVVHQESGVTWIDDSKATNPDAAIRALEAFNAPIILIAGGKSKKTDFAEFAAVAGQRAKLIVLIGEAAPEIAAQVRGTSVAFAGSLAEAVESARRASVPGDVVLLSPACASFDMFASAEQRGDLFAELAQGRSPASGVVAS